MQQNIEFFEKASRRLLLFDLKDANVIRVALFRVSVSFSSCVVPESVGFVSSSVCACIILGACPGRGRRLWECVKGLLIKNSRTVPWRETYPGKNINE